MQINRVQNQPNFKSSHFLMTTSPEAAKHLTNAIADFKEPHFVQKKVSMSPILPSVLKFIKNYHEKKIDVPTGKIYLFGVKTNDSYDNELLQKIYPYDAHKHFVYRDIIHTVEPLEKDKTGPNSFENLWKIFIKPFEKD